jgi:hypothetical protein
LYFIPLGPNVLLSTLNFLSSLNKTDYVSHHIYEGERIGKFPASRLVLEAAVSIAKEAQGALEPAKGAMPLHGSGSRSPSP